MAKGIANTRYKPKSKVMVVETMRRDSLSYKETERQFELPHNRVAQWERIYLEEGTQGLCIERRGRKSAASGTQKARPAKRPNKWKKI